VRGTKRSTRCVCVVVVVGARHQAVGTVCVCVWWWWVRGTKRSTLCVCVWWWWVRDTKQSALCVCVVVVGAELRLAVCVCALATHLLELLRHIAGGPEPNRRVAPFDELI
jgi:hypothetical protein